MTRSNPSDAWRHRLHVKLFLCSGIDLTANTRQWNEKTQHLTLYQPQSCAGCARFFLCVCATRCPSMSACVRRDIIYAQRVTLHVWLPNGTLEADQAANVPALGRNKSCVCHVCDILTHKHTWPQLLSSAFPGPNAYNTCVWIMYGYHISATHNSDSKSSLSAPAILPLFQQIYLFYRFLFLHLTLSTWFCVCVCVFPPTWNKPK